MMANYFLIAACLLLASCSGKKPEPKAPQEKSIKLKDMGNFTIPADAEIGITDHSIEPFERYPGFIFNKYYRLLDDSLQLVKWFKDSAKAEPLKTNYIAYYPTLRISKETYMDFDHSGFLPDSTYYICSRESSGSNYYLYIDEKDWGIHLSVKRGNLSDTILVSKLDKGCMTADFVLHDISGDIEPEVIVFSHCMIGPHEVEQVSVFKVED